MFSSVRFRITILFVLIFGSTLVVFSGLLYSRFIKTQQTEFDASLFNFALDVNQSVDLDVFGDFSVNRANLLDPAKIRPFSLGKAYLQVMRIDGTILLKSRSPDLQPLQISPQELHAVVAGETVLRTVDASAILPAKESRAASTYRVLLTRMGRNPFQALVLEIVVPMTFLEHQRNDLFTFFVISIPLLLLAAALGGLFVSDRALRPVGVIIERTRAIQAADLEKRIPVPPANDELRQLALTLNELLGRLQQAFQSQERFVADASHQLKTPLTILRTELDLLRQETPSVERLSSFVESASQEIDYLSRMVEDLLLLARIDAGSGALTMGRVRMDELLLDAVARLENFSRKNLVKIRLNLHAGGGESDSDYETTGDPDLLRSLFQNIIENAVKFSPEGGAVDVLVSSAPEFIEVAVKDEGPGIPAELIPKIFDRFFSLKSEGRNSSGVGLGLPIVRRIAEAHGAQLEVDSQVGRGTSFRLRIKKF